jgi:hypothetical protein
MEQVIEKNVDLISIIDSTAAGIEISLLDDLV